VPADKVIVMGDGLKLGVVATQPAAASALLEEQRFTSEEIARAFGVPSAVGETTLERCKAKFGTAADFKPYILLDVPTILAYS
jgi:hypothetical protein